MLRHRILRKMSLKVHAQVPETAERIIGTHDGTFHADESLAVAMLRLTKEFKGAEVLRTRNPDLLAKCNIVVDVGAKYDADKLLFDHHQREFQGTMTTASNEYKTRLSSAGLVYKHYGREIIAGLCPEATEEDIEILFDRVYRTFIEHIDGGDNGVEAYSSPSGEKLIQNYSVTTSLPSRVSNLAPRWNQPTTPESFNEGFVKAVEITGESFLQSVDYFAKAWMPARDIVVKCIKDRHNVHDSGKILKLDTFCPWQEHLFQVEKDLGIAGELLYALFPDMNKGWRVRAIGIEGSAFGQRKPLPWKGLRDQELSKESGISGCVFVHAAGFIGGNDTYEGALQMAIKALAN
eukprot:TRINITY_DN14778_c0_g1_i2.p2 TRINITY_DN14778_c0_g1~~TRINITY_DN14778_c0_g1_i2.p2  ORF type:complete len:349 (+),score=119.95 TRINITY_DN14778_c0_g1_i2:25-1071(+)